MPPVDCVLSRCPPGGAKKWKVVIAGRKTVRFGGAGYSDYTLHKDAERKARYVRRHAAREDWTRAGLATAGFWSRWLLWNLPGLAASIAATERRFGLRIRRARGG